MHPVHESDAAGAGSALIGLDLQDHAPVRESLARHGDRYLRTLLGEQERTQRPAAGSVRWVAGRFAAKEAVYKALDAGPEDAFAWNRIEILHQEGRRPAVRLHGPARELARRRDIDHVDVTITHASRTSAAMALAVRVTTEHSTDPCSRTTMQEHLVRELQERITMSDRQHLESQIREVLSSQAHLKESVDALGVEDNLYTAGMTSHASVNVMLGLEDELDIEFPEDKLNKQTFASISAIADALEELLDD